MIDQTQQTLPMVQYSRRYKVGDRFVIGDVEIEVLKENRLRICRPADVPVIYHMATRRDSGEK